MNILNSADRQEQQALARCGTPEMRALLTLFEKLSAETQESLIAAEEVSRIHRLQGRAEFLRDFLEAVKDAPSVMERLSR